MRLVPLVLLPLTAALAISLAHAQSVPPHEFRMVIQGLATAAAPAQLGLSAAQLSFVGAPIGQATAQQVSLTNSGTQALTLTSLGVSAPFTLTHDCPSSLQPAARCTATISFAPATAAPATGALTIQSSGGTQSVALTGAGQGVAFELSTTGLVDFGAVVAGGSSVPKGIGVLNTGSMPLSLGPVSVPTGFSAVQDCAAKAPGEQCTINVTFEPTAVQSYSGDMAVTAVGSATTESVGLAGQGVASAFEVRIGATLINSYDFGSMGVGATSDIVTFTLKNVSGAPVTFGTGRVSVAPPFTRTSNTCGGTLAAGASCTTSVTFSPTAAQQYAGSLQIDANTSAYVPIPLTGTGVPQSLSSWNLVDYPAALPTAIWDIEYADGFYAAVGDGSRLSVGATLSALHQAYVLSGATGTWNAIVKFKDTWVVAERGYGRINIWKGLTASATNQPPTTGVGGGVTGGYSSLATDGNRLVAGTSYPTYNSSMATTDEVTWKSSAPYVPDIGAAIVGIKQANGTWVAAGGTNVFALSTDDGATWAKRTMSIATNSEQATSVTYGAGVWVMTTNQGRVFTSTNALNWQSRTTPATGTATSLNWVEAGPNGFVAVGNAGTILQSLDGMHWARMTSPFSSSVTLRKVKYLNGQWLIIASTLQFATTSP